MNWDNVKVFLAVAKSGSVSGAGDLLGINHTTVLRRIRALESELATTLFSRGKQGYQLTTVGERVLDLARLMEQDASALARQVVSEEGNPAGLLKVATPPGTCLNLMGVLGDFQKAYPHVALHLDSQTTLHDLDKMEADVAIRLTQEPPRHYMAHLLFEMPFRLYGSRDYLSRFEREPEIPGLDWLCYAMPTIEPSMEFWLRSLDDEVRIVAVMNTLALVLQGVEQGMGVSFLPEHLVRESEQLLELDYLSLSYSFPVYLLAHRDIYYQPHVKAFFEFVRSEITTSFIQQNRQA